MTKTVRLSDESYAALEDLREKRETFDEAFKRLIKVYQTIFSISDALGPGHYLQQRPTANQPPPSAEGPR